MTKWAYVTKLVLHTRKMAILHWRLLVLVYSRVMAFKRLDSVEI